MKKLLILFLLASCTLPNKNISSNNLKFDFKDDLSFDQFNLLLIQYAKQTPYPNIDQ
tara:strand:+ start:175 stop:345 length:171 start_codon:yes stop_codon:yes gene_type:complete